MALDTLGLIALLGIALVITAGGLVTADDDLQLVLPFLAAIVWGAAGLSAFDVVVGVSQSGQPVTEPMYPIAWLSVGMAGLAAVYGVYYLVQTPADELQRADVDLGGGRR